jgi:LPXTG-site transpeptidase (sortase) family protein
MKLRISVSYSIHIVLIYITTAAFFLVPYIKTSLSSQTHSIQTITKKLEGTPIHIIIPHAHIDLDVEKGSYNFMSKTWNLAPNKAFFADITKSPNSQTGNTLIYGHNTQQVFLNTRYLKQGDELYVLTNNNKKYVYTFEKSELVDPDDVTIISYQGPPQLTLLTCNGANDQWRRLMYFKLSHVI